MRKKYLISLVVLFILLILTNVSFAESNKNDRFQAKYIKTADGDTARFIIDGENVRVRFLGINTPEISGENKVEEPFGNEAFEYTKNKLDNAKKIELEYDDVADKEDRFGRKLCYIWVDDELYEKELLEQGLAKTYMLKNNYKYADELKSAERKAKDAKIGVWSESEEAVETSEENVINSNESYTTIPNTIEQNGYVNEYSDFSNEMPISYIILIIVVIAVSIYLRKKNYRK